MASKLRSPGMVRETSPETVSQVKRLGVSVRWNAALPETLSPWISMALPVKVSSPDTLSHSRTVGSPATVQLPETVSRLIPWMGSAGISTEADTVSTTRSPRAPGKVSVRSLLGRER